MITVLLSYSSRGLTQPTFWVNISYSDAGPC